jgi:DNA-directed RNA polymerase subunit L
MSFQNYAETGTPLLTDPSSLNTATFELKGASVTVANTLRRVIKSETRSVGFRADLTNAADPGVVIRKNTSVIFNEMLAHRLTLIPLGVRNIDDFDPSRYECVLRVRNDKKGLIDNAGLLHVKASDFQVYEKQADGTMEALGAAASAAMFPPDPITNDTILITTLRPQWNPDQPAEEIDLTAYPMIGRGRDFAGYEPVSQCSYGYTRDPDPVRQEQFFFEWLDAYKKISDPTTLSEQQRANFRQEWENMAAQRCYLVNERGEPESFSFTVESVGIRPVKDIVAEGIRATIELLGPYADAERSFADLDVTVKPIDSRANGVDVVFNGQEHTLGELLQALITELYLDTEAPDAPITYVGDKIRHPLHRSMTLRLGIREGAQADAGGIARQVVQAAAERAISIFTELGRSWTNVGSGVAGGVAAPELDG